MSDSIQIKQQGDAIFARLGSDADWAEVKIAYVRPISYRDGQVSIVDKKTKEELAFFESIDELTEKQRAIVREALVMRYSISIIEAVESGEVNHGHRYLKVNTNRGFRYFNLKEPGKNVTWLTPDHLIIRDSMGNRYEIPSIEQLDSDSRKRLEQVL